jgi:hypothetical protein
MGSKSRETVYRASIRASAERAKAVRQEADRLGLGMLGYKVTGAALAIARQRAASVATRTRQSR